MSWQEWGGIAAAVAALITSIATLLRGRSESRRGVRATEHEGRRDTISDRDALIDQLQEQVADLRETQAAQASRITALERDLRIEREYTSVLRDHIYRGETPPPPPRPTQ